MDFRTKVKIEQPDFKIEPCEQMLFVGSCFADNIGKRFASEKFRVTVNPYGVMYNPASILHTVKNYDGAPPRIVVLTLGTNHVYILNDTGEIVDNCRKRPQSLFTEKVLSIDECVHYLSDTVLELKGRRRDVRVIVTVSPIRYAKYGYHDSKLSKAVLLLAAESLVDAYPDICYYFPAYEIINDELRDYRFYASDMLHPSEQAVEYIWELLRDNLFSDATKRFLDEWRPIKEALAHRPFHPEAKEYKDFMARTMKKLELLKAKYPEMEVGLEKEIGGNS